MTWAPVEPLVDTPEQQQYWREPKIGDRVRVRLSGECRVDWRDMKRRLPPATQSLRGHVSPEEGLIGTVDQCPDCKTCPCVHAAMVEHPFPVSAATPFEWNGVVWGGGYYAACELEILS